MKDKISNLLIPANNIFMKARDSDGELNWVLAPTACDSNCYQDQVEVVRSSAAAKMHSALQCANLQFLTANHDKTTLIYFRVTLRKETYTAILQWVDKNRAKIY